MSLEIAQSNLKLIYFNMRARGEIIRYILYTAGKSFIDQRVELRDWEKLKSTTPFGQLPVLEVTAPSGEKRILTESLAIARLLARTYDLYGKTPTEIYYIERILSLTYQFMGEVYALRLKKAEDLKLHMKPEYITDHLNALLDFMKDMTGTFVIGNKVSIADFQLMITLEFLEKSNPSLKHEVRDRVQVLRMAVLKEKPSLEKYIKSRPKTEL